MAPPASAELSHAEDPLRLIGNAAFRGLLARIEQGEWLGMGTNGQTSPSLQEVVETVDKLDALRTRGEDRLARRLEEAEARAERAEKALAEKGGAETSALALMMKSLTDAMTHMQQQVFQVMQQQYQQTLTILRELRAPAPSSSSQDAEGSVLARIGRQVVEKIVSREDGDDAGRIEAAVERAIERHLSGRTPPWSDPQAVIAYLNYDLEKFKTKLQAELQHEGLRRSREIGEQIVEYLGQAAGRAARARAAEPDEENTEEIPHPRPRRSPRRPATGRLAGYIYTCWNCGGETRSLSWVPELTCEHCGATMVVADGSAAPTNGTPKEPPSHEPPVVAGVDGVAGEHAPR